MKSVRIYSKPASVAFILAAGVLWGFMGVFVRTLTGFGFSGGEILFVRCLVAAALFGVTMLVRDRKAFAVSPRHFWCFFGSGICSLLFFTFCYFAAMQEMSLSAAAILLYTAPAIVTVLSCFLFGEKLTAQKVGAVFLSFAGCCLVSGIAGGVRLSAKGLLLGLCAGAGYALYSIFARCAINRGYGSLTVNFYSCMFAALGACLLWDGPKVLVRACGSGEILLWCLLTGLLSCYLPYLLYTLGLAGVETGTASVVASVEPAVATLVGVLLYKEALSAAAAGGMLLVLGAIVLLNLPIPGKKHTK